MEEEPAVQTVQHETPLKKKDQKVLKRERKKLKKEKKRLKKEERRMKRNQNRLINLGHNNDSPNEFQELSEPQFEEGVKNKNDESPGFSGHINQKCAVETELDTLLERFKLVKKELDKDKKKPSFCINDPNDIPPTNDVTNENTFNESLINGESDLDLCGHHNYSLEEELQCSQFEKSVKKAITKVNVIKAKYISETNPYTFNKKKWYTSRNDDQLKNDKEFDKSVENFYSKILNIYNKYVKNKNVSNEKYEKYSRLYKEYLDLKNYQVSSKNYCYSSMYERNGPNYNNSATNNNDSNINYDHFLVNDTNEEECYDYFEVNSTH